MNATPTKDNVAIVVVKIFRKDFVVQYRLVAVKQFKRVLKSTHWQNVILEALLELRVPRPKFVVGLSDGCP